MIINQGSVFPIVVFDAIDNWESLMQLIKPHLDSRGLKKLKTVLAGKCQCVVVEHQYIDKDYRDTFSHFHSKRFSTPSSRCIRLHFFSAVVTEAQIIEADSTATDGYLGYSVIRPTKPNCIGRTFVASKLRLHPKAHISVCDEDVILLGTRFTVSGFPFISQDADATVCAESALWMLLRYYSNRYQWYPEILPFQITSLAGNHAAGTRVYPSSGLYSWQLAAALRAQRFAPVIYSRKQYPEKFDHLLYTYIESGLPLLVTVPEHVVVAFGHFSDYSADQPASGGFHYTSHFNRAFIVNDDNCHPYQTLYQTGMGRTHDSELDWEKIQEFIVPLPEKVFLPAEQAQTAIETALYHKDTGIETMSPKLSALLKENKLLFRFFLTSARSLKRHLRKRGMGNPIVESLYRHLPMPHFIWTLEFAEFDEYADHHKVLGEVIWDATRNGQEPDGWIALHYPEKLIVNEGAAFNGPQVLKIIDLVANNSYSLLESNLHTL